MMTKSRLVSQNDGDEEAGRIATKARNIKIFGNLVLLSMESSILGTRCYQGT